MNILVTGANGFIASNLIKLLSINKNFNFFEGNRQNINLFSKNNIEKYLIEHKIDSVIHCAIEGGSRLHTDDASMFYKNILIFENLNHFNSYYKLFINISSGAEFDREKEIYNIKENEIFNNIPQDYYGLSKNIISKCLMNNKNSLNLRIFGCFYHNELNTRFIKSNIIRYINKTPMIIHQDKFMDFIYFEDVYQVINHYLLNTNTLPYDINMSYVKKYKLTDITNIINNLSDYKIDVKIENENLSSSYCGNGERLESLNLKLKGLELGIKECYHKLL